MRIAYHLCIVGLLAIAACDKKNENATPASSVIIPDSSYIINGIQNIEIGPREKKNFPLIVQYTNKGEQELINLSASGMPDGVSISFNPNGGIPSFNTMMTVDSKIPINGSYPINIEGTSTTGKKKNYTTTLNVSGYIIDCGALITNNADKLKTTVSGEEKILFQDTDLKYYTHNTFLLNKLVMRHLPSSNEVVVFDFNNVRNGAYPALNFNCDKHTVTMQEVTILYDEFGGGINVINYTISGTGTFNSDSLEITYTSTSSNGTNIYHAVAKLNL